MNELEIVCHPQIPELHLFFDAMEYRTPHFHSEWEHRLARQSKHSREQFLSRRESLLLCDHYLEVYK